MSLASSMLLPTVIQPGERKGKEKEEKGTGELYLLSDFSNKYGFKFKCTQKNLIKNFKRKGAVTPKILSAFRHRYFLTNCNSY